jgi:hypothetical protein
MFKRNTQAGQAWLWILVIIALIVVIVLAAGNKNSEEEVQESHIDQISYSVEVSNTSEDQPLSPGVYVVHSADASLDFAGELSPAELEPLAEYGDNTAFAAFLRGLDGVKEVITIDEPILPGESASFEFMIESESAHNDAMMMEDDEDNTDTEDAMEEGDAMMEEHQLEDLFLSGIQMAVGSNDGYALVNAVALDGQAAMATAKNYDNGTEENSDLNSGFEGGQPDAERGEENVDNGTATDPQAPVAEHDQLTETILTIKLTPTIVEHDDAMMEEDDSMSMEVPAVEGTDEMMAEDDADTMEEGEAMMEEDADTMTDEEEVQDIVDGIEAGA